MPPSSPATSALGFTTPQRLALADAAHPFTLISGEEIAPVIVEYEDYGPPEAAEVILICHALSGDAHAAGCDQNSCRQDRPWRSQKIGWWDEMIGPNKALDTNRYRIICSNVLGGCGGTTGPADSNPNTGVPYGMTFPLVTIQGWVKLQKLLIDRLGIKKLFAVIGGSLGGQQALEWALAYPEMCEKIIVLAASARLSAQGLGFNAVGRYAIMNDPHFNHGNYYGGELPRAGLAAARMLAHITYLSDEKMHEKFGRRRQEISSPHAREVGNMRLAFDPEIYEVESYLNHQGQSFVQRFDANSYMYITRAMDLYDAAAHWGDGDLNRACRRITSQIMLVSFSSDWLYPPKECRELALAISRNHHPVTYVEVPSNAGHDAFLIQTKNVGFLLKNFLDPAHA